MSTTATGSLSLVALCRLKLRPRREQHRGQRRLVCRASDGGCPCGYNTIDRSTTPTPSPQRVISAHLVCVALLIDLQ